ncbi:uncharacterized protein At1g15400-like [Humulus lupulus]|uniref:uncharacterized protein At1g15400-like n=1 Tax=Humulus lupulus TaxID=3486 RepID=UPI002B413CF2|nr:uncharacterized protein At1g15400-like [Humulus lupulus]
MAGLQRSVTSFRRQGSSGMVWDDRFLGELHQLSQKEEQERKQAQEKTHGEGDQDQKADVDPVKSLKPINTVDRSRSNGGRGYRTGKVAPAIEPPSPKVSACGLCSPFGKAPKDKSNRRTKTTSTTTNGKRRSR